MSILDSFSNLPDQPEIAPYKPSGLLDVIHAKSYATSQRIEFGIVPTLETLEDYIDRQTKLKQRFTQDELKTIQGDDKELREEALKADAEKGITFYQAFYQGYTPDINQIRNKRIDDAILRGREQDPRWSDIKTTEEIQEEKRNRARSAIKGADEIASRASTFDNIVGSLIGGIAGAFTDPINLATLPFGATSGMGILKAMKAEAILNAGVEAVEAPFVAKWQKELGFKYGIGDAALDIGTAGIAGAGFTGIVKGARPTAEAFGRLFDRSAKYTKEKSLPILQKISDSENLPTAVKDAAKYMSRVAHIDEEVPSRQGLNGEIKTDVSAKDIVQHRQTLQDTQDAFDNYREPVFDKEVVSNIGDYSDSDAFEQYQAVSAELNKLPKPKGLLQFLKEGGGIKDDGGELRHIGITAKSYPGLLRNSGHRSIDYARETAIEAGYLPDETTVSDFLEAIREDFVNRNVFDERGHSIEIQRGHLEDGLRQLDEYFGNKGINLRDKATVKRLKLEAKLKKPVEAKLKIQEAGLKQRAEPIAEDELTRVENEINQAGFDKETSKLYSQVFRSFYETQLARGNVESKKVLDEAFAKLKVQKGEIRNDIKEIDSNNPNILFQSAPTFYSALEKQITDLPQAKGSPEQWAGIIKNLTQKGVKQEELDWTGVEDWIKEQKGSVTKQQILDYLAANKIEVEEVVKSDKKPEFTKEDKKRLKELKVIINGKDYDGKSKSQLTEEQNKLFDEYSLLRDKEEGLIESKQPTKFSKYTLAGGENYRELLLTLQNKNEDKYNTYAEAAGNYIRDVIFPLRVKEGLDKGIILKKQWDEFEQKYKEEHLKLKQLENLRDEAIQKIENFQSSHYDEKNILAHIRFNERTDKDGKRVMFIEELQSDWMQSMKKQKDTARDNLEKSLPDAPFKTTWNELAFKRVLMWAVENKFDKVAWTTGEMQAERYDLSKQIKRISVLKSQTDGKYQLVIEGLDGQELDGYRGGGKTVTPQEMEDTIGKEISKKAITLADQKAGKTYTDNEWADVAGGGLKVGGEGMKAFYDKIVPTMVNKLVKKFGGKVETADIKDAGNVHSLEITPAMRESIQQQGLPLFQRQGENAKGSIEFNAPDGKTIISLFEGKDLSTLLHETGHFFLETQKLLVNVANAPDDLKQDWRTTLNWLGSKDGNFTKEQHEQFARGFEAYLREGNAPSPALIRVFERFKQWLTNIYKDFKELGVNISDEMRGVFDGMLATDEQTERVAIMFEGAEMSAIFRPNDALASMERDVADLDSLGEDVYNADFERLLKEQPDLEIETPQGRMTIREIADQIKEDDNILSAIKTCAIG